MAMQAIKAIDYMSALKVGAVVGLIEGIILGLMVLIGAGAASMIPGAEAVAAGAGVIGLIMAIIFGLIGGAIAGIVGAVIYNVIVAKVTGGLKIDLQ
jgi:hypothetical protein